MIPSYFYSRMLTILVKRTRRARHHFIFSGCLHAVISHGHGTPLPISQQARMHDASPTMPVGASASAEAHADAQRPRMSIFHAPAYHTVASFRFTPPTAHALEFAQRAREGRAITPYLRMRGEFRRRGAHTTCRGFMPMLPHRGQRCATRAPRRMMAADGFAASAPFDADLPDGWLISATSNVTRLPCDARSR